MTQTRYTKEHEFVRLDGDTAIVGITGYAQQALGDVVYVELPAIGRKATKGQEIAVVESVKAASEIYAPLSGEVIAVNTLLEDSPATVNEDSSGKGWFLKMRYTAPEEFDSLMSEDQYEAFLKTL
jgi:glycine cleavage system H protein